jgi:peptidylprolyl isomerase
VIKLTEQQPARVATLDELRERLTQALRAQRQEQIAKAYLEGMLNTATLSIDGAVLNKVLEEKQ